MNGNKNVSFKK